jgi:Glycosyl hydrolase family 3 N terminal domain
MTVAQKVSLLTGAPGSRYVGFVRAIRSLCIPALKLEDGPAGVGDGMTGVTQLPAPVAVAATWDTSAERTYGQVIGSEQAAKGTTVDLGPTINIVRDPRWGRAFESIGEDPYLAGTMGAADIRGVQSTGVMAMVKHLAVYNQETNRNAPAELAGELITVEAGDRLDLARSHDRQPTPQEVAATPTTAAAQRTLIKRPAPKASVEIKFCQRRPKTDPLSAFPRGHVLRMPLRG